mmetsp:Transcript_47483/g.82967  ORF Transcript_47483/g.82967 Transcript_47483/m.82967 type:complete len:310 (+) Transcript_47483:73-1002(+)
MLKLRGLVENISFPHRFFTSQGEGHQRGRAHASLQRCMGRGTRAVVGSLAGEEQSVLHEGLGENIARVDGLVDQGAAITPSDVLMMVRLPVPVHATAEHLRGARQATGSRGGLGVVAGHVLLLHLAEDLLQLRYSGRQHLFLSHAGDFLGIFTGGKAHRIGSALLAFLYLIRHVSEPDLRQQEVIVHHDHSVQMFGPAGLRELHDNLGDVVHLGAPIGLHHLLRQGRREGNHVVLNHMRGGGHHQLAGAVLHAIHGRDGDNVGVITLRGSGGSSRRGKGRGHVDVLEGPGAHRLHLHVFFFLHNFRLRH